MCRIIAGECREAFSHSTYGDFDITALREYARNHLELLCNVDLAPIVEFVLKSRVYDESRVSELSAASWQFDPGLLLQLDDGTHLFIDGTHRAIRRMREGLDSMALYMIPFNTAPRLLPDWIKDPKVDWGDDIVDGEIVKR